MSISTSIKVAALFTGSLLTLHAHADFSALFGSFSTELEERSARAVFRTYQRLLLEENCVDRLVNKPPTGADPAKPPCSGRAAQVFRNIQRLIHTGNEIAADGPTGKSLGFDRQELGRALRWLAAEEYAGQGDMSKVFVDGQLSSLSERVTALRAGSTGFQLSTNGIWFSDNPIAVDQRYLRENRHGGSAGVSDNYSRLGGFLNIQIGNGSRDGTGRVDGYDFDGFASSLGFDYRWTDEWILGAVIGLSDQEIVFDRSQSVVDGSIGSKALSVMPFASWQRGDFYLSTSLGVQSSSFDSERAVRIDPNVSTLNTTIVSDADASTRSFFAELGYTFRRARFSLEPFASFTYAYTKVDEFTEKDLTNNGFDLTVKAQVQEAKDLILGVKAQYTFTPSFGVMTPYLTIQSTAQFEDDPRDIESYYGGLSRSDSLFFLPVEDVDERYGSVTLGVSSVIRGGRELTPGGKVGGDIQAYASIKKITGLQGFDMQFYTAGLRYAF